MGLLPGGPSHQSTRTDCIPAKAPEKIMGRGDPIEGLHRSRRRVPHSRHSPVHWTR